MNKFKDKGSRVELEIVNRLLEAGIPAHRIPLSGAVKEYPGDVLCAGNIRLEIKARANGEGFAVLERWLGDNDALVLRRDRKTPIVAMTWDVFESLLVAYIRKDKET